MSGEVLFAEIDEATFDKFLEIMTGEFPQTYEAWCERKAQMKRKGIKDGTTFTLVPVTCEGFKHFCVPSNLPYNPGNFQRYVDQASDELRRPRKTITENGSKTRTVA
jgi:hypothetical protein